MSKSTSNVAVFWRAQNNNRAKMFSPANARDLVFQAPAEKHGDLAWLLAEARRLGVSKGSFQSGIYEVQSDAGIFRRADGMRLGDNPAKDVLKTWAQLEAEDLAA